MRKLILTALIAAVLPLAARADDSGLELSAGVAHKLAKGLTLGAEAGMRTRNNFRTMDRWSVGVDLSYKVCNYLKASAGYTLLDDNNMEKITRNEYGEVSKWRPSYWGLRHRVNVSLTGSVGYDRFSFSLRERWQYTYRPEKTVPRFDFEDDRWEDRAVKGKGKSVLRSRAQIAYDIRKCKVDPYLNVEFFNAWRLEKTRFTLGAEWKISKKQSLGAYYRYQLVNQNDDEEADIHRIGIEYNFKF